MLWSDEGDREVCLVWSEAEPWAELGGDAAEIYAEPKARA